MYKRQEETRAIINNKINKVIKKDTHIANLQNKYKRDARITRNVYEKLRHDNAIVTKADKGNTVVIINKNIYIPIRYRNS